MADVTHILHNIDAGDPQAADQLLPLVYDELRRLAAAQLAQEKPGHTLNATALVHEAYLRLVGDQQFENRRHFFAAAAEAMRRILIDSARRKNRLKHGGAGQRVELVDMPDTEQDEASLLAVDEVIDQFAAIEPQTAELVKLHVFAGLSIEEAGAALDLPPRTAYRYWAFARAWMYRRLQEK